MQIELTPEQQNQLKRLAVPFHPDDVEWRVVETAQNRTRGRVSPYSDPRAYTDRLNQIFTPAGWTRTYEVTTVSPVTRVRKDTTIQTGKVIVTCTITILDLGSHTGSGERWADDDNAMTGAEAQAFKRACTCFGLGRYFYDFAEMWVNLNKYGKAESLPDLPKWALPEGVVPNKQAPTRVEQGAKANARPSQSQPIAVTGKLDPEMTRKIEDYRKVVGDALYFEVFRNGKAKNARDLPHVEAQQRVLRELEVIARGVDRVRALASEVQQQAFFDILDHHKVQSIDKIPSFAVLKAAGVDLARAAQSIAA